MPPSCRVNEQAWLVVLQVAPSLMLQHLLSAEHQPGSGVVASTHTCGVTLKLHTSPPPALPLPTQSVSFVQGTQDKPDTVDASVRQRRDSMRPKRLESDAATCH